MSDPAGTGEVSLADLRSAAIAGEVLDADRGAGGRGVLAASDVRRCLREFAPDLDARGLRVRRARITGALDLSAFAVPYPIRFEDCDFTDPIDLQGAELHGLDLIGCTLPGLLGNGLRVRGDVNLSGSDIEGRHATWASEFWKAAVWLCEAEIGGRLTARGTRIAAGGDRAVHADRLVVAGTVRLLHGFRAEGEVRLLGARVGGSLELAGAALERPGGWALNLAAVEIGGNLYLNSVPGHEAVVRGRVDLGSAQVAGNVIFRGVRFEGPATVEARGTAAFADRGRPLAVRAPGLSVGADLTLAESSLTGELDLSGARLGALSIESRCRLVNPGGDALTLANAEVRSGVLLGAGLEIEGRVQLPRTRIDGRLVMRGVRLSRPRDGVLVDGYGLTVHGVLDARGLRADGGGLVLNDVECAMIDLREAWIEAGGEVALDLRVARVHGDVVVAGGFTCRGRLVLNGAQIDGWLDCEDGTFEAGHGSGSGAGDLALSARSAVVTRGMDLTWAACGPRVDFTAAATTTLIHETGRWPAHYAIGGLTYDRFRISERLGTDPWDVDRVCEWLDGAEFDTGAYEQAARVFRQHGRGTAAEDILIRQRDAARRAARDRAAAGPTARMREDARRSVDWAFGRAVGYGYRPGRALIALIALLVAGFALLSVPVVAGSLRASDDQGDVYGVHGRLASGSPVTVRPGPPPRADSCGNGEVRCFNRLFYAVDTVIPLVDLKQRETWYPDAAAPWGRLTEEALDVATLLGWLLSSIVVLSFARLARTS